MFTVSPGHFGPKTGASGFIDEVTEAIKVSKRLTAILRSASIITNYIEDSVSKNKTANINWLIAQHNETSRDIDVSVHFNASGGTSSKGIGVEVLYFGDKTKSPAANVSKAISDVSGLINRGAKKRTDLGILRGTNKPCILIEVCFVNDSVDVALYKRDFEKICQAIASELAVAVGKTLKPSTNSTSVEDKVSDTILNGRKLVREAVREGVFDAEKHTERKINSYSSETLLRYALIYIDRSSK